MPSYKYNPLPKWRVTYFNKNTNKIMEKEFRNYKDIENDNEWNTIIKNKDFLHNHYKRLIPDKHISVRKLR